MVFKKGPAHFIDCAQPATPRGPKPLHHASSPLYLQEQRKQQERDRKHDDALEKCNQLGEEIGVRIVARLRPCFRACTRLQQNASRVSKTGRNCTTSSASFKKFEHRNSRSTRTLLGSIRCPWAFDEPPSAFLRERTRASPQICAESTKFLFPDTIAPYVTVGVCVCVC